MHILEDLKSKGKRDSISKNQWNARQLLIDSIKEQMDVGEDSL